MSLFSCDNPQPPSSSQPTIPVILRGKKRQHNKSQLQQPKNMSPYQPKIIRNKNNLYKQPEPFRNPITYKLYTGQNYFRSVSAPRRVVVNQQIYPRPKIHIGINPRQTPQNSDKKHLGSNVGSKLVLNKEPTKLNHKQNGNQIRKCLDQKLSQVYNQLKNEKIEKKLSSYQVFNQIETKSFTLDKDLVSQYIKLIYQDYKLLDPLEATQDRQPRDYLIQQQTSTQPYKKNQGSRKKGQAMMSGSTNKKAVQLKQSFLIQMFSPAQANSTQFSNKKRTNNQNDSDQKSNKKNIKNISVSNPFAASGNLAQITEVNQKQIKQVFRYCFVCQQPILQGKIDNHQRQKCPQFSHLYSLNLHQIRQSLIRKILRIKKETSQIYECMFGNQRNMKIKLQNLKTQARRYLQTIDTNIQQDVGKGKNNSPYQKEQIKDNFSSMMKCYQQNYLNLYANMRKLHWFMLMLKNLQDRHYKNEQRNQSSSPNDRRFSKATKQTQLFQSRRLSTFK